MLISAIRKKKKSGYNKKLRSMFGTSLVAYWPMWDAAGAASAQELIGGTAGSTANLTFGASGIGDGKTAASFGPTLSRMGVSNSASRFNMQEGSFLVWLKADANLWAETGVDRGIFRALVDASNGLYLKKSGSTANTLYFDYLAGGVDKLITYAKWSNYGWFLLGITWSKTNNRTRLFVNGVQLAETTGVGTWAGATFAGNATLIGNQTTSGSNSWKGGLAHACVINREATAAELRNLVYMTHQPTKYLAVIGDSISANPGSWAEGTYQAWNGNNANLINHAVGGNQILLSMATQVAAAATDDADVIIMQLGVNDNNAGDMAALQTIIETSISTLRATNPRAAIYYMNVLPCWTNTGGGTPVDKSNIRTAIAAACLAKGVTCWDTFSTPWIAAGETSDGTHPTAAGNAKIVTQVLARI